MKHLGEVHNRIEQRLHHVAGDLREEFAHAITREVEFESKTSAQLVQSVNDELTELITRSNQYHSHRYFGMVEDVKQVREMCDTLKKSIGMVDAELSDTKETVDFLKDEVAQSSNDVYDIKENLADLKEDIYSEMDRDYYDMKGYVRHKIHQHNKASHTPAAPTPTTSDSTNETGNGIQLNVDELASVASATVVQPEHEASVTAAGAAGAGAGGAAESQENTQEHNVIIIDADTIISDDEDEPQVTHT
jgi:uncharacterized phage infection (PIP) family protein YhgE